MAAEVTIDFLSSFVEGEGLHGVRERIRDETTTQSVALDLHAVWFVNFHIHDVTERSRVIAPDTSRSGYQ